MAKRLHMTSADYVAIAISPALIMTLVGSLVYFLIEVFYAGEYQARLNYVFALFVFSAVLIARISIEMSSERAAGFGLALGIATFLVLQKFVEHPSALSPLINLGLIATVWWCAHKLTWDCTLIDDDEDASGEGLLQRVGVDGPEEGANDLPPAAQSNELVSEEVDEGLRAPHWWDRFAVAGKGPHTPGLWVLYFSLAALPLFGIGQHWIPAAEIGRRRYAFGLLAVYVFSALSLLVATSFLGLRRYLRQRNLEMSDSIAGTWITMGAVLIAIVMFVAALLPRPAAEVAISQAPWQVRSPEGLSSSRYGQGSDGTLERKRPGDVVSNRRDAPEGDAVREGQASRTSGEGEDGPGGEQRESQPVDAMKSRSDESSTGEQSGGETNESGDGQGNVGEQSSDSDRGPSPTDQASNDGQNDTGAEQAAKSEEGEQSSAEGEESENSQSRFRLGMLRHEWETDLARMPQQVVSLVGGLVGILKLLFYLVIAALVVFFVWKNRQRIAQSFADIMRSIRAFLAALFGRGSTDVNASDETAAATRAKRRTFAEFRDPFSSGVHRRAAPEELVRYTFEAFEAWAGDRGLPRSAAQTPQELVRAAVAPQTPLHAEARRMVGVYSALAYAGTKSSTAEVEGLRELWRLMAAER